MKQSPTMSESKIHASSPAVLATRLFRWVPCLSVMAFMGGFLIHAKRRQAHLQTHYYHNNPSFQRLRQHLLTTAMDDILRQDVPVKDCPYMSFADLTQPERLQLSRDTGKQTLVCCSTTVGPWNIMVHHSWAPFGAQRFLDMVRANYFSVKVPLMRCVQDWICQFGLAGRISENWKVKIPDDPQWLPQGQPFQTGYLGYAGSGPKSRGRQFFVALSSNNKLGKTPWEVPWGETIGEHSFETLKYFYTGYGEEGPDQDRLTEEGAHQYALQEFPNLDYITSCRIVDEE